MDSFLIAKRKSPNIQQQRNGELAPRGSQIGGDSSHFQLSYWTRICFRKHYCIILKVQYRTQAGWYVCYCKLLLTLSCKGPNRIENEVKSSIKIYRHKAINELWAQKNSKKKMKVRKKFYLQIQKNWELDPLQKIVKLKEHRV